MKKVSIRPGCGVRKPSHILGKSSGKWFSKIPLAVVAVSLVGGGALAQRPLGTDVSGYQPSINWTTVKNAGVVFAFAKATEGTGYTSPEFTSQMAGAKGVGIYVGAYHFSRPDLHPNITGTDSADSEANYYWSKVSPYVKYGGAYLVPMLDWEAPNATVANGFTTTQMSQWLNRWCTTVSNNAYAAGVIVRPVVYTGTWYSTPSSTYPGLNTTVTNWLNIISGYPANPNPQTGAPGNGSYPWPTWNIWQYADTNWSGGDSDVFNGTLAKFIQTFVIGGTNAPAITANPTNFVGGPGSNVMFTVKATGQTPLTYRWYFNGSLIPGASTSSYPVPNAQMPNAGGYSVTVSNSYGAVPANTAFLSVISQLTNGVGAAAIPTGLVDWWPGEGNARDIFGAYHGTPQNGFSYASGKEGLAYHFNGTTSYVTNPAPTLAAPWTVSMWVYRQNAPGTAAALMSDGTYSLKLEQYNGTRQVGITQLGVGDYVYNYTVPVNTWVHLAFVNNGSQTLLYANGVSQGGIAAVPLPRSYIGATYVGSNGKFVDFMLGSLDELMVFNRVLSPSEISAIAAAGSVGFVRAPMFTSLATVSESQFQLSLRGITGKSFSIYKSLDLDTWTKLGTISNPSGNIQYTDPTATNGIGFYRLTQP